MDLNIIKLGKIHYKEALQIQKTLQGLRKEEKINDTLLLLEHYSVITLGKRGKYSNIKISENILKKENIKVYEVNRGGDVTYHGPGQLVGYIFFDLRKHGRDIKKFIWELQEVFIRLLEEYGINSYRDDSTYTGVWIDGSKITAIGIAVKHWITMHGFSFNINTDLFHYNWINPCGIIDKGVTSLEKITAKKHDFDKIVDKVIFYFSEVFDMKPVCINIRDFDEMLKRGVNVYN